jgi:TolB-like protein/Flp pilus assembly protein TadD
MTKSSFCTYSLINFAKASKLLPSDFAFSQLRDHRTRIKVECCRDERFVKARRVNPKNFFAELKRRNVYKVAIGYAVVAWLVMQIATQVFPFLEIPNWAIRLVIMLIVIGFPIALVIAWAFELTPEGLKRTEFADESPKKTAPNRAWIYVVIIAGAISASLFFFGRYTATSKQSVSAELPDKSIAVLPFENLSRDPDNAYFAEGMQDEILARLSKIADLKVISRTSTQKYKSAPDNLREIAKQLGVANILEGSVQKAADQVRVNVQLINALNDAHLWSDIYDRKLTDIFAVESDIAKTIADTLQAKLTAAEKQMIAAQPTSDTAAYELYLKGRSLWGKRGGDNLRQAIAFYEQAIAGDPNFAPAYAGLAEVYSVLPYYTATAPGEAFPKAKAAALKALQLDDKLAEAHTALAQVLYRESDMAGSIAEFQRAVALNPNYATAHQLHGNHPLAALGRFDEAIAEGKRAIELDPLSPIINSDLGETLYLARRYDEAIAQLRKAVEIDPTFWYAHEALGVALQLKGDVQAAIAQYEKAQQLSDDLAPRVELALAKAQLGDKEAAVRMLAELEELSQHRYVNAFWRTLLYLSLNNHEEAIRWLEQAVANHEVSRLKVHPVYDPLRGDPRFEALVQKVVGPEQK